MDLSCLGRTIYARQFWVASHRFNSATGGQKGITQTIYTDSEQPSRMPNSLMPSAKLRSANLLTSLVWCGRGSNPSRTPKGRTNHYATWGRYNKSLDKCHNTIIVYPLRHFWHMLRDTKSYVTQEKPIWTRHSDNDFPFHACRAYIATARDLGDGAQINVDIEQTRLCYWLKSCFRVRMRQAKGHRSVQRFIALSFQS